MEDFKEMANIADLVIRVPQSRLSCAAWILAQTPEVAADALELAGAAYTVNLSKIIDRHLSQMDLLDQQILASGQLQKNLLGIREGIVRESMICVRLARPSLVLETPEVSKEAAVSEAPVDPWSGEDALQLLEAIKQYKAARKRYPKILSDIDVSAAGKVFAEKTDNAILLAVNIVKKGQKRSASHAALPEREEGDAGDSRPSAE